MVRRALPLALVLLPALGCLPEQSGTWLAPANPFSASSTPTPTTPAAQANYAPATSEAATRVLLVGQKLLAANPQLGLQPAFRTIGAPQPEVFHTGTTELFLTEGLVKQCSDGQLAAVLALELGKMVAEREAHIGPRNQVPEREPPPPLFIGSDGAGNRGPADMTYLAQLAPYEQDRKRASAARTPPEPNTLARGALVKAGFAAADLDAAGPLLRTAATNNTFEKQLGTTTAARSWAP